jgi:hypothetical protein
MRWKHYYMIMHMKQAAKVS